MGVVLLFVKTLITHCPEPDGLAVERGGVYGKIGNTTAPMMGFWILVAVRQPLCRAIDSSKKHELFFMIFPGGDFFSSASREHLAESQKSVAFQRLSDPNPGGAALYEM